MASIEMGVGTSTNPDTLQAVAEATANAAGSLGCEAGLALVTMTVEHDASRFLAAVRQHLPGVPLSGCTTSLGVLGTGGVIAGRGGVVGVLLFGSPDGRVRFDTACVAASAGTRQAAEAAATALRQRHPGELPRVLVITASPGAEEDALLGLDAVFPGVPAYGGSAADHAIQGQWSVFGSDGAHTNGVAVAALFGEVTLGGAFLAPYRLTERVATVTSVVGRTVHELDARPAADVLGEWVGEGIAEQVRSGGVVLAQTALSPVAIRRVFGANTHHLPVHPFQIQQPGGKVALFAKPEPGDVLCALESTPDELVAQLGPLVEAALRSGKLTADQVAGGLLIYCAGCAGAVGPALDEGLRVHLQRELGAVPLLGLCTFGEQGHVPGLGNLHQNLSLGLLLFGR